MNSNSFSEVMRHLFTYISENIDDKLTLDDLAKISSYSPFHFQKKFKRFMGETPNDYVMRMRVELAAHYLWYYTSLPITEIAYRCGFSSPSHLSRSISQYFHTTPRELRKKGIDAHINQQPKDSKNMKVSSDKLQYTKDEVSSVVLKEYVQLETLGPFTLNVSLEVNGYEPSVLQETWNELAGLSHEGKHYIGVPLDNPFITPKEKCRYLCGVVLEDHDTANYQVEKTDALTITIPNEKMSRDEINAYYYQLYNEFPAMFGVETVWDYPFEFVYLAEEAENEQYQPIIHKICIPVKKQ